MQPAPLDSSGKVTPIRSHERTRHGCRTWRCHVGAEQQQLFANPGNAGRTCRRTRFDYDKPDPRRTPQHFRQVLVDLSERICRDHKVMYWKLTLAGKIRRDDTGLGQPLARSIGQRWVPFDERKVSRGWKAFAHGKRGSATTRTNIQNG